MKKTVTYRKKKKSGVLVYTNATLFALLVTMFIIKPAKEALTAILGNAIGGAIYYFLKIGNYCVLMLLLGWFLYSIVAKRRKVSMPTYCMLFYTIVLLYSTIRMGSYSLIYLFELLGSGIAFFILFDMMGDRKIIDCIRGIYYYLTAAMLLNSISIYICYPDGVYTIANGNSNYYLYALDNVGFLYEIAALSLGVVYHMCREHKIPLGTFIIHVVILGAYFYSRAATAMVVAFCAVLFILTYKILCKLKLIKFFSFKTVVIASAITFFVVVILHSVSAFSWLFDLIGRDLSFSSRTSIWAAALNIWREHWLLGVGTSGSVINSYLHMGGLGAAWGTGIGHLHNIVLEVLFDGGVAALFFFIGIMICPYRKMQYANNHIIAKVLCVFFFLQWLSVTFDFRMGTYTFWLIPIMMYHVPSLVNYYNRLNNRLSRKGVS